MGLEALADLFPLLLFIVLMIVGYAVGSAAEKSHYASIERREAAMRRQPVVTMEELDIDGRAGKVKLVSGNAVMSMDYFKRFLAGLRFFFGGRVKSYESLLDRARREAVLRMKLEAGGAHLIMNLRVETSFIGNTNARSKNKGIGAVEALAYGTAVWVDEVRPQDA